MTLLPAARFSVVMAAHDAAATIEAAVRSVLLQTVGEFELLVADDGSADDTSARARRLGDPRVRVLERERAGGPSAARNAAIAVARGDLVSVIDSDDLWLPRYLEAMGEALDANASAGFAYTDAWVLDDETRRIRRATAMAYQRPPAVPPADPRAFARLLVARENFVFSHVTMRRSVLQEVGGYDERLGWGEDFELWLRILEAGYPAVRVAGPLAIYRRHRRSRTSRLAQAYDGICKTYDVILSEHDLDAETRELARVRRKSWLARAGTIAAPSRRTEARRLAGAVKARLLDRTVWVSKPPADVAATLAACEGAPPRPRQAEAPAVG